MCASQVVPPAPALAKLLQSTNLADVEAAIKRGMGGLLPRTQGKGVELHSHSSVGRGMVAVLAVENPLLNTLQRLLHDVFDQEQQHGVAVASPWRWQGYAEREALANHRHDAEGNKVVKAADDGTRWFKVAVTQRLAKVHGRVCTCLCSWVQLVACLPHFFRLLSHAKPCI
jgi:hypothetical protein